MRALLASHRFGERVVPPEALNEIVEAVRGCPHLPGSGKTTPVRDHILDALSKSGWSGEFEVDRDSAITITSVKGRVGLCLQTGNMSRMYADLLKLQTLYLRNIIDAAVMLLPTDDAAREFGSNIANQERLMRELAIFERVITVPAVIVGIEGDRR